MLRGREELKNRGGWGNGRGCGRWGCPEGPRAFPVDPIPFRPPPSLLARAGRTLRWASRGSRATDGGIFDVELGEKWLQIPLLHLHGSAEPRRHRLQVFISSRSTRVAAACGRVGSVLGRGGRVGGALLYGLGGCGSSQLGQQAQLWALDALLGPSMAPFLLACIRPLADKKPHVCRSVVKCMGTWCPKGHWYSASLWEC